MAAMIWLTSAPPSAVATLTLTIRASGAMPTKCVVVVLVAGVDLGVAPGDDAGHVGAVPVAVEVPGVGVLALEGEVRAVDHLAGCVQPGDGRHAGVDERDVDAACRSPSGLRCASSCSRPSGRRTTSPRCRASRGRPWRFQTPVSFDAFSSSRVESSPAACLSWKPAPVGRGRDSSGATTSTRVARSTGTAVAPIAAVRAMLPRAAQPPGSTADASSGLCLAHEISPSCTSSAGL